MPQTKTKCRPAAKTQTRAAAKRTASTPAAAKRTASTPKANAARRGRDGRVAVERTTELSEDVLKSLDESARSALDAVRKFAETVDRVLPPRGEGPSRREEIADSALEMAQRLVHTQADFLRKVVDNAGKSLTRTGSTK
jgi:tRNA(Ser,Leu) C12 N-acetylase TAN1